MTTFPFAVNRKDFLALVHKYGYQTNRLPVFTEKIRTMDGVDHSSLIRTKGILTVTLNPAEKHQMMLLMEELQVLPARVTYYCFQTGMVVTETMIVEEMPLKLLLQTAGKDWVGGVTLTFEQM